MLLPKEQAYSTVNLDNTWQHTPKQQGFLPIMWTNWRKTSVFFLIILTNTKYPICISIAHCVINVLSLKVCLWYIDELIHQVN